VLYTGTVTTWMGDCLLTYYFKPKSNMKSLITLISNTKSMITVITGHSLKWPTFSYNIRHWWRNSNSSSAPWKC